jgi:hypothetical protein
VPAKVSLFFMSVLFQLYGNLWSGCRQCVEHQNFYIIIHGKRSRTASKEAEGGYEISKFSKKIITQTKQMFYKNLRKSAH